MQLIHIYGYIIIAITLHVSTSRGVYSSRDWRHSDSLVKSYNLASTQNQPEVFIQVAELSAKKVAYNLKALCIVTRGMFQLNDPGRSSQAVASTYEEASLERLTEVADILCVLIHVQNRNTSAKEAKVSGRFVFRIYASWLSRDLNLNFTAKLTRTQCREWSETKRNKRRECLKTQGDRLKVRLSSKVHTKKHTCFAIQVAIQNSKCAKYVHHESISPSMDQGALP